MTSLEVIGVMPPGFAFPDRSDVWLPMESWYALNLDSNRQRQRDQRWYATVARLKPGVSLEQAQVEMDRIARDLEAEYPRDNAGVRVRLRSFRDATVGSIRPYVLLLMAGVALVLIISVVNVSNLLLARMLARQKQYAIQAALGASRWQLAQGLIVESLVIALAGGVSGAGLAWISVAGFRQLLPASIPLWMRIELVPEVLVIGCAIAIAVGVAMGLLPAWLGSRVNLESALRQGARGGSGATGLRSALVVCEVALSLLLMVGAGLLMKTFMSLQRADHGFQAENLIVARVSNSRFGAGSRESRARLLSDYHSEMRERLLRIPGVTQVAVTNGLPYSGSETRKGRLRIQGKADDELRFLLPIAGADVQWDFFQTMKIPLVRGRYFERSDSPEAPPVVIINETAAKALFGDADPVGRLLQWGDTVGSTNPYCRIVGVVRDIRWEATERDTIELFYPFTQWPVSTAHYLVRTASSQADLGPQIRKVLQTADDRAAIVWIKSMTERIDEALWQRRLWGVLFTVFAAMAIVLAAVGLYGVLGYTVSQRTREIGIRLALGALPFAVRVMVVGQGMKLVAAGTIIGGVACLGVARLLNTLVDASAVQDWTIYGGVALVLVSTGLLASAGPALRASRVEPLVALRND